MKKRMRLEEHPDALATLVRMYPHHTSAQIAEAVGCSSDTVRKVAIKMGIKKSAEFLKKYPQTEASRDSNAGPLQRISHPKPGVTIHRIM